MNHLRWTFLTAIIILTSCNINSSKIGAPIDLVVSEGFKNPIGFHNANPTFSWKLQVSEKIKSQSAFRIVVSSDPSRLPENADLWDTNKVDSDQSVWVKYEGTALESRQKIYWQIMFWDQDGNASSWSEVANIELGLLHNSDWQAKWINVPEETEPTISESGYFFHRPQYLRKRFDLENPVAQARLYITSKGVFEAEINGEKVGQDVMTPGWTSVNKRIETLTYDVTKMLEKGENAIGVVVAEGWYSGRIAYTRSYNGPKPVPQLICQLEITFQNGERQIVTSDASWKGTINGPIRLSDIYEGEDYDANLEFPGWRLK